ncbi:MAG: plastocyanin/azurin family copper-binding protein [Solirubrobacterales bacterium]
MRHRNVFALVLVALVPAAVIGCGGDDDGDGDGATTAAGTQPTGAATGALTIKMGDFFFNPKDATSAAGSVQITAPNEGKVEHELVVFRSNDDPAALPLAGGEVDEGALEAEGGVNVGEIEGVQPGQSKSGSFDFTKPGKYVMFCNLPAHYEKGMYGSITVD